MSVCVCGYGCGGTGYMSVCVWGGGGAGCMSVCVWEGGFVVNTELT